jgi:hypothetical protein
MLQPSLSSQSSQLNFGKKKTHTRTISDKITKISKKVVYAVDTKLSCTVRTSKYGINK